MVYKCVPNKSVSSMQCDMQALMSLSYALWKIYHQLKLGHGSLQQDCTIEEMGGWRRCQRMWHSCHRWCLNLT